MGNIFSRARIPPYKTTVLQVRSFSQSHKANTDDESIEDLSHSRSSSSATPEPLEPSDMKKSLKRVVRSVLGLQTAVDEVRSNTLDTQFTYSHAVKNNCDKRTRKLYRRWERRELDQYTMTEDDNKMQVNKNNVVEKAKEYLQAKQDANKSRAEYVGSNNIALNSDQEQKITNQTSVLKSLNEDLETKGENFKKQINKLERLERNLESQPNKEVVKQSLIDDYADLSTEIMDVIDFD